MILPIVSSQCFCCCTCRCAMSRNSDTCPSAPFIFTLFLLCEQGTRRSPPWITSTTARCSCRLHPSPHPSTLALYSSSSTRATGARFRRACEVLLWCGRFGTSRIWPTLQLKHWVLRATWRHQLVLTRLAMFSTLVTSQLGQFCGFQTRLALGHSSAKSRHRSTRVRFPLTRVSPRR